MREKTEVKEGRGRPCEEPCEWRAKKKWAATAGRGIGEKWSLLSP